MHYQAGAWERGNNDAIKNPLQSHKSMTYNESFKKSVHEFKPIS
jgi:hypothetical protein